MHTRMLYRALHASNLSSAVFIQDLSLPYSTAEEFIAESTRDLAIWPVWLCPLRETSPPSFHPHTFPPGPDDDGKQHNKNIKTPKSMLNVGIWGRGARGLEAFVAQNREIEATLKRLGARKVLYSHAFYTGDQFWGIYDKGWYDGLREALWCHHPAKRFRRNQIAAEASSEAAVVVAVVHVLLASTMFGWHLCRHQEPGLSAP
jgi:delta24-sterol reductase